jgi:hypothetical protein
MTRMIKVPRAHVHVYKELKESTVEEFIKKNVVLLGEYRTNKILKNIIRWGLVEIEKCK